MQWNAPPTGKRGRQADFSDTAIQFCLTIKCLFNLALRQTTGFVESLLQLANLDWKVSDSSMICRRQKHLKVVISARKSLGGLQLLVDSTGIKILGEGDWKKNMVPNIVGNGARFIWVSMLKPLKYVPLKL